MLSRGILSSGTNFSEEFLSQSRRENPENRYPLHACERLHMTLQPSNCVFRVHIPDQRGPLMLSSCYEPPRGVKTCEYRVRREGGLHSSWVLHREGVYTNH